MSTLSNAVLNANNISLGEFVTTLVLRMQQKGITMPFQNEEKWHKLFYCFKKNASQPGRPAFLDKLRFDWDGRYPKAQDLSEYLQALHWNGFVSVANPTYDRMSVDQDVAANQQTVSPHIEDQQFELFL